MKIWIFNDTFYKKGPVLVILVAGMIQPLGLVIFWWNEAVKVIEATKDVNAVEVTEAAEVLRSGKHYWGLKSHPGSWIQLYFDV